MTIQMMLNGGGLPPFVYYLPHFRNRAHAKMVTTSASAYDTGSSKTSADKEDGITDKDLLELIKKVDALPSDSDKIFDRLDAFMAIKDTVGANMFGLNNLASEYVQIVKLLQRALYNKQEYDKTYNTILDKQALPEIAITNDGNLLVEVNGKILPISIEEYNAYKKLYNLKPLTNSELLQMRGEDEEFAFSNNVLNIVNGAISMGDVQKKIFEFVKDLGTNEVSNSWYESRQNLKLLEGVQALTEMAENNAINKNSKALEGLFKVKETTSQLREAAAKALEFMYRTLPDRYKTLLKFKTLSLTDEEAVTLLAKFFDSRIDMSVTHDENLLVDSDGQKLGATGKKTSSGGEDGGKTSIAAQWYLGFGAKKDFIINSGTTFGIHVKATVMPITNKDGQSLGRCNIQQIMESQYGPMFDVLHASMNGEIIDQANWEKVLTDGQVYSIDMPVDPLDVNHSRPNLELSKKLEKFYLYLRENHIELDNYSKINEACEKFNLPIKYTPDGQLNYTAWKRFAVMNATALGSAFNERVEWSDYVHEILDHNLIDGYKTAFAKSLGIAAKDFKFDEYSWWDKALGMGHNFFTDHESMYQGTLFIPLHESYVNAIAGAGTVSQLTTGTLINIEEKEQLMDRIKNMTRITGGLDEYE